MELTWYGLSCFRFVERKYASIVTDPYSPALGLGELKLRADVITISHNASGHNYVRGVGGSEHVLIGPGEYEIGNVFITGTTTNGKNAEQRNIVYLFDFDGLTVAHLGDMGEVPSQKQIEALELVNVLLVPVGGGSSLNAAKASELVSMLEPNIVVPMHYQLPKLGVKLEEVDRFLKEMGATDAKEESSLKVSADRLPEETEVVLLSPRLG
jgi:L-ascorbate metabolism protein UlaG (beta-lactamase superfamily)